MSSRLRRNQHHRNRGGQSDLSLACIERHSLQLPSGHDPFNHHLGKPVDTKALHEVLGSLERSSGATMRLPKSGGGGRNVAA